MEAVSTLPLCALGEAGRNRATCSAELGREPGIMLLQRGQQRAERIDELEGDEVGHGWPPLGEWPDRRAFPDPRTSHAGRPRSACAAQAAVMPRARLGGKGPAGKEIVDLCVDHSAKFPALNVFPRGNHIWSAAILHSYLDDSIVFAGRLHHFPPFPKPE